MEKQKVNHIKKFYRISLKFLQIFTLFILSPLLKVMKINVIPNLGEINFKGIIFNNATKRIVFNTKNKEKFNKIYIDTSLNNTNLCELGKKFSTNKSPINLGASRSGYTGVYNLLFSHLANKKIFLAEIGIEKNASIKMWRKFFKKATIHGFEFDNKKIKSAKKDKLKKTFFHQINVNNQKSIISSFKKINNKFDIIIDDSTHLFDDQIRIIKNCYKYINNNGMLIIEDIYKYRKEFSEKNYFNSLKSFKKYFSNIVFIDCSHVNNYTSSWKNEKILLLIRNNKK